LQSQIVGIRNHAKTRVIIELQPSDLKIYRTDVAATIYELASREAILSRKHKRRGDAHTAAGMERVVFAGRVEGAGNATQWHVSQGNRAMQRLGQNALKRFRID